MVVLHAQPREPVVLSPDPDVAITSRNRIDDVLVDPRDSLGGGAIVPLPEYAAAGGRKPDAIRGCVDGPVASRRQSL